MYMRTRVCPRYDVLYTYRYDRGVYHIIFFVLDPVFTIQAHRELVIWTGRGDRLCVASARHSSTATTSTTRSERDGKRRGLARLFIFVKRLLYFYVYFFFTFFPFYLFIYFFFRPTSYVPIVYTRAHTEVGTGIYPNARYVTYYIRAKRMDGRSSSS